MNLLTEILPRGILVISYRAIFRGSSFMMARSICSGNVATSPYSARAPIMLAGLVPWKQRPRVVALAVTLPAVAVLEQHRYSVIPLRAEHTPARCLAKGASMHSLWVRGMPPRRCSHRTWTSLTGAAVLAAMMICLAIPCRCMPDIFCWTSAACFLPESLRCCTVASSESGLEPLRDTVCCITSEYNFAAMTLQSVCVNFFAAHDIYMVLLPEFSLNWAPPITDQVLQINTHGYITHRLKHGPALDDSLEGCNCDYIPPRWLRVTTCG